MRPLIMLMTFLPVAVLGYSKSETQRSDSYLGIYCIPKYTTSAYPHYDEVITYGERDALEFELSIVNEEGKRLIFLPEDFQRELIIELSKDGERLPMENLEVWFSAVKRKYIYDPGLSEQDYNPSNLQVLEVGVGVRTSLILKRRSGIPFSYGLYTLICYFRKDSVKFENGTNWRGRGGRGGSKFRILNVETPEDQRKYYIIKGGEFLQKNQPEQALEMYRELIKLAPEEIGNYAMLGNTYMRMKRYQEAIAAYEKALPAYEANRQRTTFPYNLAYCYLAIGREAKAREVLGKFFGTGTTHVEETIRRIKMVLEKKRGRYKKK